MPSCRRSGRAVAGARGDEVEIAVDAIGDEGLASGEEIVIALPHRARRQRGHVGPGAGLGDAERADGLALDDAGEVLLLLRLGAVAREPGRGHVRVHEHAERHAARPAPRHLLAEHDARQEVAAASTVLDRELEAEQSQLAEPPPERPGDTPRFLPCVDMRSDFLVHEGADRPPQHRVLVAEDAGAHRPACARFRLGAPCTPRVLAGRYDGIPGHRGRARGPSKRTLVAGADLVYPDRHSEPRGLQGWRSARRPSASPPGLASASAGGRMIDSSIPIPPMVTSATPPAPVTSPPCTPGARRPLRSRPVRRKGKHPCGVTSGHGCR